MYRKKIYVDYFYSGLSRAGAGQNMNIISDKIFLQERAGAGQNLAGAGLKNPSRAGSLIQSSSKPAGKSEYLAVCHTLTLVIKYISHYNNLS